ncbi:MAG: SsrA-binding protein [Myxococcales bacterium]|nr:SsrA-binding protein [Myxococcales bacterium]
MASDGKSKDDEVKVLLRNKRARHDYFVERTIEAGLVLQGSEVKSLREARAVMSDAYAMVNNGEAWLVNLQVTEYPWANHWNHAPKRDRKLLLHRKEIEKLDEAASQAGYTLLPLEVYLKNGRIKVLLGVCKGKKQYDKRQDQKKKDAQRDIEAALRRR